MSNDHNEPALEPVSDAEIEKVLAEPVETGQVPTEVVNSMGEETAEMAKIASEVGENTLTPEQQENFLSRLKVRFAALHRLHQDINWIEVEKSLKVDPEAMRILHALDEKGHDMNVLGEENGELIFVSGWIDYRNVSEDHRNIVFDKKAQDYLAKHYPMETCNGNAVDIVRALGADLADLNFHEQLRILTDANGWAWLKTDAVTRESGYAFGGINYVGFKGNDASNHGDNGSFRAELRVKKT